MKTPTFNLRANILLDFVDVKINCSGVDPAELCSSPTVNYLKCIDAGLRYRIIARSSAAIHADPPKRSQSKVKSDLSWYVSSEDGVCFLFDALIRLIPIHGPWIIFGIVAFESAGVPLPGETILVAAALLAATTAQINIVVVVLAAAAGAIVGDGMGYIVGRRLGLPLLRGYGRYIGLDEDRLLIGRYLFLRYGNSVVFFGRFIAVLRMFAALLAGANRMPAGRFFFFNITGGVCWASLFGFGAYAVGRRNLQDFWNAERDLIGFFYCGGICTLTFYSTT